MPTTVPAGVQSAKFSVGGSVGFRVGVETSVVGVGVAMGARVAVGTGVCAGKAGSGADAGAEPQASNMATVSNRIKLVRTRSMGCTQSMVRSWVKPLAAG